MSKLMIEDTDGVLAMLQESVQSFSEKYPGPKGLRNIRNSGQGLDKAQWQAMIEAGWIGLLLPETLGGSGLSLREQVVISHALGEALIVSPMVTASVLTSVLLAESDVSLERSRLASDMITGKALVIPAINHVLQAQKQDDGFYITGCCEYLDAGCQATDFIVLAQDDTQHYLLSISAQDVQNFRTDRPAVDGTILSSLQLEQFTVAADQVLASGNLDQQIQYALDMARLALSAELAGLASKSFLLTSEYTQQRIQFGKPIASFQVIQHRLVDMWAKAEFACASIDNAIECLALQDSSKTHMAILAAKIRCSDAATGIGRQAVHLFGAMGFTDECDIGLYLKRSINLAASLGDAEKLRMQFIAMERAA
ncbi:acyl-CoA dehydrogenase [Acinetobacter qingfengensis]|uniref:Acyl-CoA dehydrogenase n=1 Tax=Acinetobacter qingfengensis TaxID=1262585 RepID=A0A1E7RCC3_9GAMM|nr:acyl-CoA dehydrogenase family protein [Acinetobacter qingfengensis]KAA8735068.1 acyl-CoA dehydrogenase [Acinetobacter qingfengensis]OEY97014.1 acyl-CoA dehydrogenase [Acinetobacter qingfengensis]